VGRHRDRAGYRRVRGTRWVVDAGAHTHRRRLDPAQRRTDVSPGAGGGGTDRRRSLWTSRVWPGAVLVDGEIVGTWRRAQHKVAIETWRRLSRPARDAVEAEAASLPLPGLSDEVVVHWDR
jgi:hypothetical protein